MDLTTLPGSCLYHLTENGNRLQIVGVDFHSETQMCHFQRDHYAKVLLLAYKYPFHSCHGAILDADLFANDEMRVGLNPSELDRFP